MKKNILFKCIFFAIANIQIISIHAQDILPSFKFNRLTTQNGLPNDDVQKIYQDREGYIWIASKNGLHLYDGYTFKTFKSNLYHPNLLSYNNILCLEEDYEQRLWIGTSRGLNMMDKKNGEITQINRTEFVNNSISAILVTKDNKLLLGTDLGLYQYIYETDSCIFLNQHNTNGILTEMSVKSIIEDAYGHVWIGTWNKGLFRFDPKKNVYYAYPQINPANSVHVLFEDSQNRIWIGTWGEGLQLLENPYDLDNFSCRTFNKGLNSIHSINHFIYSISEDLNSKKIWIGTPDGLSILKDEEDGIFVHYYPGDSKQTVSDNEINSIIRDKQGMMWLGLLRGGINTVSTRKPDFESYPFDEVKEKLKTKSVITLFMDDDGIMWMNVGSNGLVQYNRKTNKYKLNSEVDGFNTIGRIPSILTFTKLLSNGQIWIGTYNAGVYIYDNKAEGRPKVTEYPFEKTPWLAGSRVYSIYEDSNMNIWLGTNSGLTMVTPDFEYVRLDSLEYNGGRLNKAIISDIKEGAQKEIWAASSNCGVFRIFGEGKLLSNYSIENYSANNGKLNSTNVSYIHKDAMNRIWIGSEGGGLSLYDREKNSFIPVHQKWNLPGDAIINITDDTQGNLWMGTNMGLMKLTVSEDLKTATYRLYTTSDGLLNNTFTRRTLIKTEENEIFFGGYHGVNSFFPDQIIENDTIFPPVVITDIKIHNRSWIDLEFGTRNKISAFTPEYTDQITLNYKNNNFTIEFAALGYENPSQHSYAYKLDGFDTQWQYTGSLRRFAYYNNLKPGKYSFNLKTTNVNGLWNDTDKTLQIMILPPPWETWWAYSIYTLFILGLILFVYRMLHNRMKLRNALQLREMEKAKIEELNHTKLQFFTNITHELLTPLSIISASVDDLKNQMPQYTDQYRVMSNNINRLIRLLQQILEFRKAETGNLHLKVSHGDLVEFVTNSIESFRPLIKKKQLNLSVSCNTETFPAYFDPDKLDKILYNLLSNASKYNKPGGNVMVKLYADNNDSAVIEVEDNGQGISKEAQKTLFKRFYEGDYRKFNTIGTGIGLSLTKDLVTLHGGTISVESEEGAGTLFRVIIPINRNCFPESQIDDTIIQLGSSINEEEAEIEEETRKPAELYNILLIEDNEDLLQLMVKLLHTEYTVYVATNGEEGLDIIKDEDIDLVISDIMMPVMDGIELCKHIKNSIETSHIPVLLLTAKTGESSQIDAYESGADAYIKKPFNLNILYARIKNLLKARERTNRDFKKQLVFEGKELNYTSLDEAFLQKAIDCVHQHLDDPNYDQNKFTKDMGTSRSTMLRKMKSLTGMNFVSFIRNIRLKAACRLLEEKKNIRISELAYAVGFSDPKYFSTCFKKEFGMQPREYYEKFIAAKE